MLIRVIGLLTTACWLLASAPLALAGPTGGLDDPKVDLVQICQSPSYCFWIPRAVADQLTRNKRPGTKPAKSTTKGPEKVCLSGGAARSCTSRLGNWSNSQQCYLKRLVPQPPFSDAAWQGHTDGAIWSCVREPSGDESRRFVTKWIWLPGRPDTVVVDPMTLVYEAIAQMKLAPPLIRTAPSASQIGLVHMPVWLWVTKTENTWGPIVRSASVPGLAVTVTAKVKAINWAMGDGSTVRCEGPGTPYTKAMGVKASPTCGHRYAKTSHSLPNCSYSVTAVTQWDVTWQSTIGDNGQIPMTQQAATQLRIGEAVPVLVDPDGGDTTTTDSSC